MGKALYDVYKHIHLAITITYFFKYSGTSYGAFLTFLLASIIALMFMKSEENN